MQVFNVSPTWLMGFDEDFEKESESNRKATKETRGIDDAADIFGNAAQDFLSLLKRLDEIDRAKIMERMETMLENEKYQK